ncbi:hypothetical protein Tco_0053257 [Tanacetum coccineum]
MKKTPEVMPILNYPTVKILCAVAHGKSSVIDHQFSLVLLALILSKNANPPPTSNCPVLPAALRVQAVQELHELQRILAFVDSRLEISENDSLITTPPPNEINMNDLESDDESIDTPLVSPFPHSDNDSDDGEVLNELVEYENARTLRRERTINSFDGDDPAFQCMKEL